MFRMDNLNFNFSAGTTVNFNDVQYRITKNGGLVANNDGEQSVSQSGTFDSYVASNGKRRRTRRGRKRSSE